MNTDTKLAYIAALCTRLRILVRHRAHGLCAGDGAYATGRRPR